MFSKAQKHRIVLQNLLGPGENPDEEIDVDYLKSKLDDRAHGKGFDQTLFDQLVDWATRNGPLTISSFADTWVEGEQRLQEAIEYSKMNQDSLTQKVQDAQSRKIEAEATERLNAMNIMEGSELYVTVKNVENIRRRDGSPIEADFYLSCEGSMLNTGVATDPDNFIVNKNFSFPIKMGNQPLEIRMIDVGAGGVPVGAVKVLMSSLASQELTSFSYNFRTASEDVMLDTIINIDCRWNKSNVKYYDDLIFSAQNELRDMENDQLASENFLVEMVAPFPELSRTVARTPMKEKIAMLPPARPVATLVADEKPWNKLPTTSNPTSTKFMIYSIYFYLIAAFLASFDHCVFLDLTIALILFGSVQLNTPLLIQSLATKAIFGIVLAIVLGIIWLVFYLRPWWNTGYVDNFSLLSVRRSSIVFELLLMIARFVVLYALSVSYKNLQKGQNEFVF